MNLTTIFGFEIKESPALAAGECMMVSSTQAITSASDLPVNFVLRNRIVSVNAHPVTIIYQGIRLTTGNGL